VPEILPCLKTTLLLEEILESLARIHGLRRDWRGGFFFSCYPDRIGRAIILYVLPRNPHGDRLQALKVARWVEVHALLAGVQFKAALWTALRNLSERSQQRAALRATRYVTRSRHLQGSRSKGIFLDWLFGGFLLGRRSAVLITALAILAIRHEDWLPRAYSHPTSSLLQGAILLPSPLQILHLLPFGMLPRAGPELFFPNVGASILNRLIGKRS
jgi:hypothetical protein